jgi:hypothetical protein
MDAGAVTAKVSDFGLSLALQVRAHSAPPDVRAARTLPRRVWLVPWCTRHAAMSACSVCCARRGVCLPSCCHDAFASGLG